MNSDKQEKPTKEIEKFNDWAEILLEIQTSKKVEWELEIGSNNVSIEESMTKIQELSVRNNELRLLVQAANRIPPKALKNEALFQAKKLYGLSPEVFERIEVTDNMIVVYTHPIQIITSYATYTLGKYEVRIFPKENRIRIINASNNTRSIRGAEYPHPHVNTSGEPCFGNLTKLIYKLFATMDYFNLLVTINRFLQSYSSGNCYAKLERWGFEDGEYEEDGSDYESCYDNSSINDCLSCREDDCPYYERRFDQCYDYVQLNECLTCSDIDCPYQEDKFERCYEESDIIDCLKNCNLDNCPYYENYDLCYDRSNQGEACKECDITDCPHYQEIEETTEEIKDEPNSEE